jgi:hypothetical protein
LPEPKIRDGSFEFLFPPLVPVEAVAPEGMMLVKDAASTDALNAAPVFKKFLRF